eukprot:5492786-Alexandrium_andersonii.AAC.1
MFLRVPGAVVDELFGARQAGNCSRVASAPSSSARRPVAGPSCAASSRPIARQSTRNHRFRERRGARCLIRRAGVNRRV